MLWIELPYNPANTYARHTETLDSCFDLISSVNSGLHNWRSNQPPSRNSTTEPTVHIVHKWRQMVEITVYTADET